MKQHQKEAIEEQIELHTKRLDDPELTDHARTGIQKLIDDHKKQLAKSVDEELSFEDEIKKNIEAQRNRLKQPDLSDLEREGIKQLISDLKAKL